MKYTVWPKIFEVDNFTGWSAAVKISPTKLHIHNNYKAWLET